MAQLAKFPVKKNSTKAKKLGSIKYNKKKKQYLDEVPTDGNGWWIRQFISRDISRKR